MMATPFRAATTRRPTGSPPRSRSTGSRSGSRPRSRPRSGRNTGWTPAKANSSVNRAVGRATTATRTTSSMPCSAGQAGRGQHALSTTTRRSRNCSSGVAVADQEERKKIYHQAEQLIVDDAPWVFLGYQKHQVVTRANITDFQLQPTYIYYFAGVRARPDRASIAWISVSRCLNGRRTDHVGAMTRYVLRRRLAGDPRCSGIMTAVFSCCSSFPAIPQLPWPGRRRSVPRSSGSERSSV